MSDKVLIIRDGVKRWAMPAAAEEAVRRYGWFYAPTRPEPSEETLAELKARVEAMTDGAEIEQVLEAERKRTPPRKSVIELCERKLTEV